MIKLINKANKEVYALFILSHMKHRNMSDNIHDLKLYTAQNKDVLPSRGEVTPAELIDIVDKLVDDYHNLESKLLEIEGWLRALQPE